MERAWRRNCHLRRDATVRFQELEMLKMGMTGEIDLAVDADCLVLGFDSMEFDAGRGGDRRNTGKPAEKIEMPPGSSEFAIGGKL